MRVKFYALRDGADAVAGTLTPDGDGGWLISAADESAARMLDEIAIDYDPTEEEMRRMELDFSGVALRAEVEGASAEKGWKTVSYARPIPPGK